MPVAFLVVAVVGALFTLNALYPVRRPDAITVPAFLAGWLTAELPFHHLALQALATIAFVALSALDAPAGLAGLAITFASWAGIVVLIRRSAATAGQLDAALHDGLGDNRGDVSGDDIEPAIRWKQIALPFRMRDNAVRIDRNIPYMDNGDRAGRVHQLDLYRPADGRDNCPTLLFIHGGAWIIGDKRGQGIPFMTHLAARGWVCVTANHRLSPKATFPDHLLDVKQVLRWIREHGAEHGADPNFVIVSGASAGGHLAALVALTPNAAAYQPGFENLDTSVQGAVLWYGVYDLTNRIGARGQGFVRFIERVVLKAKLDDRPEDFAAASPMDLVRPDTPPMLILQGTNDTLVPHAEARHFADLLRARSEAPVVYAQLEGAQHAFEILPSIRSLQAVAGAARFCNHLYTRSRTNPATPLE